MTAPTIEQLFEHGWVERTEADDEEVLGFWQHALESFQDSSVPRLSRSGQFKHLYDAARQGVVAFIAAHGYRARGAAGQHQHTFAAGVALAPAEVRSAFASMQVMRGIRHELEYSAYGKVSEADVTGMRETVCSLLNQLADEIQRRRPALRKRVKKVRCPS